MHTDPTYKPPGPKDTYCPIARGWCHKTCQSCVFWRSVEMTSRDPQTGEHRDRVWDCVHAWNYTLQLDTGRRAERAAAEAASLRNEFGRFHTSILALVMKLSQLNPPPSPPTQLEGGPMTSIEGGD